MKLDYWSIKPRLKFIARGTGRKAYEVASVVGACAVLKSNTGKEIKAERKSVPGYIEEVIV